MDVKAFDRDQESRPAASPPLAVAIVTYNSAAVLGGLLDSLASGLAGAGDWTVIVVDNDSADGSVEMAQDHPIGARVIRTGRNAGYAGGINAAQATIVPEADLLVLNPDIRLLPGMARVMQARLSAPGVGIVVPQIRHGDGSIAPSLRREPSITSAWAESLMGGRLASRLGLGEAVATGPRYLQDGPVEWATGAALMVSADARRLVGAWDETFFLYSEETDYMRRVRQAGLTVEYLGGAVVEHIGGDYRASPYLSALLTRNRIRDFGRRHGPLQTTMFRLGVASGAAIRSPLGAVPRACLRAALSAPRR